MVTQLQTLQLDKGKGKAPGRSQHAVDKLDYLVTFNRSITQAMARTMQDLSEGICVNMANFTLARRDSYLEYLRTGVKQDTVTVLHTAPLHSYSLFPDQLLLKAEKELSRSEERHSSGNSHRKPSRLHPYASSGTKLSLQLDRQQGRKGCGKASTFTQKLAKGSKQRK